MIPFISGAPFQGKTLLQIYVKIWHHKLPPAIYKTFSICFQWNATHEDLVMRNYFWLEQLNVRIKCGVPSDKYIRFVQYIKLFKIKVLNSYHLKKMVF